MAPFATAITKQSTMVFLTALEQTVQGYWTRPGFEDMSPAIISNEVQNTM